jgi:hypothetical protein
MCAWKRYPQPEPSRMKGNRLEATKLSAMQNYQSGLPHRRYLWPHLEKQENEAHPTTSVNVKRNVSTKIMNRSWLPYNVIFYACSIYDGNLCGPKSKKRYHNSSMQWPYPYWPIYHNEHFRLVMALDPLIVKDISNRGNLICLSVTARQNIMLFY